MFFVLESKNKPGSYFPNNGHPRTDFSTSNLQQAQYYTIEIQGGQVVIRPPLPEGNWAVRHVELRLT